MRASVRTLFMFAVIAGISSVSSRADTLMDQLKSFALDRAGTVAGRSADQLLSATQEQLQDAISQLTAAVPILEHSGFEVLTFRTKIGIPPRARMRFISHDIGQASSVIAADSKLGNITKIFIASAESARNIQRMTGMKSVIIDVDLALPPKVKTTFLKRDLPDLATLATKIDDIDLLCSQAIPE